MCAGESAMLHSVLNNQLGRFPTLCQVARHEGAGQVTDLRVTGHSVVELARR